MPTRTTESARELTRSVIESIVRKAVQDCASQSIPRPDTTADPEELFHSPHVETIKEEIVRTGRKLWQRQYVDGNGGNISARVSKEYVICTPTLLSKGDLGTGDLALVDLNNQRICGKIPHTSELLLHLEIYKTVPQAKAVIHCHPPYATAHAVAGVVPPLNLVPEMEVFVGPVALSPYETPGTQAFAHTIKSLARDHNTILLANHGVVCWADTVTHAEWYVEIIDTYCKTILIASQLRKELPEIPPRKIADLLELKKKLGMCLPDSRFAKEPGANFDEREASIDAYIGSVASSQCSGAKDSAELEKLVHVLTDQVLAFLKSNR